MLLCTCSTLFLEDLFWSVTWFLSINKHEDCSVLNCYTDQTYKIRFHSFPKDEKFKKPWSNFTGKPGFRIPGKFSVVCVKMLKTSYNAFPSLHFPHHSPHQQEQLDNGEGESWLIYRGGYWILVSFFWDRYFSCFALGFLSLRCYWGAILKSVRGVQRSWRPPVSSAPAYLVHFVLMKNFIY